VNKFITEYAKDVGGWQVWQQQYRYGVIVVLPPDPPLSEVNQLRAKYDPHGYAICSAHISLTIQMANAVNDADWMELQNIAAGIKQFTVKYGPVFNVLPAAPGVMLKIEPKEIFQKVLAVIESAAVFKGAPPRPFPFYPHMTIAEYIDAAQTKILTEQLEDAAPQGTFRCTHLSYIVPDASFHFMERARLMLKV
jgi:2'-5' RNA ligase